MGRHPKLENLEQLFKKGKNFSLTDAEYEKKTGVMLPKDKSYLKNRSALAKKAKEAGFVVDVIEKQVVFRKKQ